jgi:hypothetical protein
MTNNRDADRIAALEAKIEKLEGALSAKEDKPEPKPAFVEKPYQRYDPTEGMCMPLSALHAMVEHPCNQVMGGVIRDRHAPTGRPGMIPSSQSSGSSGGAGGQVTPGYVHEIPHGPQPGIELIDRGVNAALPHGPEWGKGKKG